MMIWNGRTIYAEHDIDRRAVDEIAENLKMPDDVVKRVIAAWLMYQSFEERDRQEAEEARADFERNGQDRW